MRSKVLAAGTCLAFVMLLSNAAFAQAGVQLLADVTENQRSYVGLAMAFGLGLAAAMAAFSQSRAISAALEAVARQPEAGGRLQTMMLIGVVFIETLVLLTWVLFLIWGLALWKEAGPVAH